MAVAVSVALGAVAALAGASTAIAQSSCGEYDFATPFVAAWAAGEPFEEAQKAGTTITTAADARCHQDRVIARLGPSLGGRVGYKAAATSVAAQRQLELDRPVMGVLFRDMLRQSGDTVRIDDGARMIVELDLLVRVGDAAINEATTREEALAALDAVIPFIELGDLGVPRGTRVTGPLLIAMNAGARAGVVGEALPVPRGSDALDRLAGLTARLVDAGGSVIAEGAGSALLTHPMDVVLFMVENARARGWRLEEGDLLSLGSLGAFALAKPGTLEATYTGLSDAPSSVTVTLE